MTHYKSMKKENSIEEEIIDVTGQLTNELEVNAKDIVNYETISEANGELREIVNTEILKSDELEIAVDRNFPNIVQYKIGDKFIKGASKSRDEFLIKGNIFKPKVTSEKISDDFEGEYYLYRLNFEGINIDMTITFKIIENSVKIQFEEINENGEFKVVKIQIPNHNLVSINEKENSDITTESVRGILSSDDYFYDLREKKVDKNPVNQTIAFLDNGGLIASLENNVLDYEKQVYYQTTLNEGMKEVGLWNGAWEYREKLSNSEEGVFSGITELPWSRVVISGDKN
ncbi:hypothetical protein QTG95_05315 [Clostridium perfringens]|nr:hypothetical protein [Clostridium perfringens]